MYNTHDVFFLPRILFVWVNSEVAGNCEIYSLKTSNLWYALLPDVFYRHTKDDSKK